VPATDDFARDLAPARTFIAIEEAEVARQAGMLKGGSTKNAIVIYPDRLSETPALPQAFARHKLLDLMGDLYLLGRTCWADRSRPISSAPAAAISRIINWYKSWLRLASIRPIRRFGNIYTP